MWNVREKLSKNNVIITIVSKFFFSYNKINDFLNFTIISNSKICMTKLLIAQILFLNIVLSFLF